MNNTPEPIDVPSTAVAVRPQYEAPSYMTEADRKATISDTLNKVALVMEIMDAAMRDGEHYGTIPGCGEKKALLKPGAEKLGLTFRLKPQFEIKRTDHPNNHREYEIKCILSDGTQGVGTCSTLEGKYRYRAGERKCPKCNKATIIKGKAEYGGGWLCFGKKGGCGAKFDDNDKAITGQNTERVEHDNPADFWNTCLKMGKKRAHVDAIITATACSDIFTQDVEEAIEAANEAAPKRQEFQAPQKPTQPTEEPRQPIQFNEAKFRKDAEAWLETERVKWVKENTNVKAWATLVVESCILITEPMDNVTASKLFFRIFQQLDSIVAEIKAGKITENGAKRKLNTALIEEKEAWVEHIEETAIGPDEQAAYDKVYSKATEKPAGAATDGAPADSEYFWDVICPIPPRGEKRSDYEKSPDTIGSLYEAMKGGDEAAQKRLWGFARGWAPEPRTVNGKIYQPSEADLKFREALNDFMSWHDENETTE